MDRDRCYFCLVRILRGSWICGVCTRDDDTLFVHARAWTEYFSHNRCYICSMKHDFPMGSLGQQKICPTCLATHAPDAPPAIG